MLALGVYTLLKNLAVRAELPFIALKPIGNGWLSLKINDDGVGAECIDDFKREGSLGSRLVTMLAEQLNGELTIKTKPGEGVKTRLEFSETQYKKRV